MLAVCCASRISIRRSAITTGRSRAGSGVSAKPRRALTGTAIDRKRQVGAFGYNGVMSTENVELSVSQARDRFSDAVNRAAFGGEITYVTRGRNQQRAAAIVPAELVERYEAMVDAQDGEIATKRLADIEAGRTKVVSADEVARTLVQ